MNRPRFSPWNLCALLLIAALVAGCGPGLITPSPLPTPLPTCVPNPGDFYSRDEGTNRQATKIADDIFIEFLNARANSDEGWKERTRNKALQFLSYETRRWTRFSDQTLSDGGKARIFAVFISPQLLRATALAHAINKGTVQTESIDNNLHEYTRQSLERLDLRNDYMFLIIVQAEAVKESTKQIHLPAELFTFQGTSGYPIPKIRNDPFFDQPFYASAGNGAGFIYFPFAQLPEGQQLCQSVLDSQRDSDLILTIHAARIGENKTDIKFQIPFTSPALVISETIPTPDPNKAFNSGDFTPATDLPPLSSQDKPEYWNHLARFVWARLTFDNLSAP